MERFDWKNIRRGFQGFEDLALEYVRKEFADGSWEHSPYTRDGNRDGYAVVFGYRPHALGQEEWWMEAKYSTESERLTRYRLDATIVSAAIRGNISKIVFVTNISVSTKTIMDIRAALKQAIQCRDVHFCVKTTLEYWLKQNPEIFRRYFPDTDIASLSMVPIFLSEEIDFYTDQKLGLSFCEPLKHLRPGKAYYLYFSIYSDHAQTLDLSVGNRFTGLTLLSPSRVLLSPGVTPCVVKLRVEECYSMRYELPDGNTVIRVDLLDGDVLRLGQLELVSKHSLAVIPASERELRLPSQERALTQIKEAYRAAKELGCPSFQFLTGPSAVGKTHLMDRFVEENVDLEQSMFRISFSSHAIQNDLNIFYFLIYCLYPYLPPELVDEAYLKGLQESALAHSVLLRASAQLEMPDLLHQLYVSSCDEEIFPANLRLEPRVVLLDDLQKLDTDSLRFLLTAIAELFQKKQPLFVLASGWADVQKTVACQRLKERVVVREIPCRLTGEDLAEVVSEIKLLEPDLDPALCSTVFPNVIELLAFIKYLQGNTPRCLKDFLIETQLFLRSDVAKEAVLARFRKLFEVDDSARELCTEIYWSVTGVPIHDPMTETEIRLLRHELIKTGEDGARLIPYHDLYRMYFREQFPRPENNVLYENDVYANAARTLSSGGTRAELLSTVSLLEQWKTEGRFYALLYVLEELFETSEKDALRTRVGDVAYFRLYLLYGFGVANESRTTSGKRVFADIAQKTVTATDPEILMVRMNALFEMLNSDFEWLLYDEARQCAQELEHLIRSLQRLRILPPDINDIGTYLLAQQIDMLIHSEQADAQAEQLFLALDHIAAEHHFDYERAFFKLRYAETLFFRATSRAYQMVEECLDELRKLRGPQDKFTLWASMDREFLCFVLGLPKADAFRLEKNHRALRKNFFNDYRKRLFARASVYYASGLTRAGDELLFSDTATFRELRPRQEAIRAETLALCHLLSGRMGDAEHELKNAARLFQGFPSYLEIIRHNQAVLAENPTCADRIGFCTEGVCAPGQYCIDPRCIW